MEQYCDGIPQCPDGGDEVHSGCSCEDWGLMSYKKEGLGEKMCLNRKWVTTEALNLSLFKYEDLLHTSITLVMHIENRKGL